MARYTCERCGATCHTTDGPHLCKDVAARLRRRERQRDRVEAHLLSVGIDNRDLAEAIVADLAGMGVEQD